MTLLKFKEQLETLGVPVFHAMGDLQKYPYIVYTEYTEEYEHADNRIVDEKIRVLVDYYTMVEFDEMKERIKNLLSDELEIMFTYTVLYGKMPEPIHHIFDCEVW